MYGWYHLSRKNLHELHLMEKLGQLPRGISIAKYLGGVCAEKLESLILHQNLEKLFVTEETIPEEMWEVACDKIFNDLSLKTMICGYRRLRHRCRYLIFGTRISTHCWSLDSKI